jgi:hypothetical protein
VTIPTDYFPIIDGGEDHVRILWVANTIERDVVADGEWTTLREPLPAGVYRVKLRFILRGSSYATEKVYADVDVLRGCVEWLGEWSSPITHRWRPLLRPRPLTRREQRVRAGRARAPERRRPWRIRKKLLARFGAQNHASAAACRDLLVRHHPPELHAAVDALLLRLVRETYPCLTTPKTPS